MRVPRVRRVLVCGSRDWPDYHTIRIQLERLPRGTTIIHGGARGADRMAGTAADALGFPVEVFEAEWDRYGRRAGIIRNREMLDQNPNLVLAFSLNYSAGTEHTIREAQDRGIHCKVIRYFIKDQKFTSWVEEYEPLR